MKTIKSEVVGMGNSPEYAEFMETIGGQLAAFRASDEPPVEFARRLIGQFSTFADETLKQKRLAIK
jgi:hypothetical protein